MDVQQRFGNATSKKPDNDVPDEMQHFPQYQIGRSGATKKFCLSAPAISYGMTKHERRMAKEWNRMTKLCFRLAGGDADAE